MQTYPVSNFLLSLQVSLFLALCRVRKSLYRPDIPRLVSNGLSFEMHSYDSNRHCSHGQWTCRRSESGMVFCTMVLSLDLTKTLVWSCDELCILSFPHFFWLTSRLKYYYFESVTCWAFKIFWLFILGPSTGCQMVPKGCEFTILWGVIGTPWKVMVNTSVLITIHLLEVYMFRKVMILLFFTAPTMYVRMARVSRCLGNFDLWYAWYMRYTWMPTSQNAQESWPSNHEVLMLFTSFGFILLHANSGPFDNRSYMCHCLSVKK